MTNFYLEHFLFHQTETYCFCLQRMLVENPRDIEYCKQLLPFPGRSIEVVTVEKSQQNDFSIVSESQSSTMKNDETNEVCVCVRQIF